MNSLTSRQLGGPKWCSSRANKALPGRRKQQRQPFVMPKAWISSACVVSCCVHSVRSATHSVTVTPSASSSCWKRSETWLETKSNQKPRWACSGEDAGSFFEVRIRFLRKLNEVWFPWKPVSTCWPFFCDRGIGTVRLKGGCINVRIVSALYLLV